MTTSAAALPPPASPGEAMAAKKNDEPAQVTRSVDNGPHPQTQATYQLSAENATEVWTTAIGGLSGMAADYAREFERIGLAGPQHLVVNLKPGYAVAKAICERPDQLERFQQALAALTGQRVRVEFSVESAGSPPQPADRSAPPAKAVDSPQQAAAPSRQRVMEIMEHPMIRRASELFGAQPIPGHIKYPEGNP